MSYHIRHICFSPTTLTNQVIGAGPHVGAGGSWDERLVGRYGGIGRVDERDHSSRCTINMNDDIREVEARQDKCANGSA